MFKEGPYKKRCEDAVLPAWKIEGGAMSQRMEADPRSSNGKKTDFPLEPPKEHMDANILISPPKT